MITQAFDTRTMTRMKEALERVCILLPTGGEHGTRRMIANKIIECAQRGNISLSELTEAGYAASLQMTASANGPTEHDISPSVLEHLEFMHDHG
jgi:hypothetical protein